MLHFLQKNIFKDIHYDNLITTIQKFGYDYQIVEFFPNSTELKYEPIESKNVFCWGSVKLARFANKYNWNPGSLFNENHDYRVYSQYYKENLLNWDSQVINFEDNFIEPGFVFHARPCEDSKSFTGQIFTKESWNEFVLKALNDPISRLKKETPVQISKVKEIYKEVRFFIINGKIITASQYKLGNSMIFEENNESYLHDYVTEMISIYQPAVAFVMDIALCKEGLKIVEINCINSSGFYEINLQKLVFEIHDFFNLE